MTRRPTAAYAGPYKDLLDARTRRAERDNKFRWRIKPTKKAINIVDGHMKVVSATNEGNIELSGGDKQGLGERILFINFPPKTKPLFIDFVADTACRLLEQRLNLQGETKERPNDAIGFSASWDAKHHAVDVKSKKSGERLLSVWPYAGHSEHAEPVAMALCWHLQAKQDHERNRFQRAGHFLISLLEEMPWNRPSKVGASAKPSNDAASPK